MRWMAVVLTLGLFLPGLTWAHGGEDHGDAPPPTTATAEQGQAVGTTGETFEVLVKGPLAAPGAEVPFRVFVADTRTNAPIAGAAVELSFLGSSEVKSNATPTESPGIYAATVTLPAAGDWEVMASVNRGQEAEVLALGALKAGMAAEAPAEPHAHGFPWRSAVLAALGLALLGVAAVWGSRRLTRSRRRSAEVSDV
jgi:cobalt-zinc-cadmium efflux system membrane fusion protein